MLYLQFKNSEMSKIHISERKNKFMAPILTELQVLHMASQLKTYAFKQLTEAVFLFVQDCPVGLKPARVFKIRKLMLWKYSERRLFTWQVECLNQSCSEFDRILAGGAKRKRDEAIARSHRVAESALTELANRQIRGKLRFSSIRSSPAVLYRVLCDSNSGRQINAQQEGL